MTRCPTLRLRFAKPVLLVTLVALVAVAGCVQPPTAPPRSPASASTNDPANAGAVVPPLLHNTSLARARPPTDAPAVDWKDANDTVTRIGGWRAYVRDAAAAAPSAAPAPTPPASAPAGQR